MSGKVLAAWLLRGYLAFAAFYAVVQVVRQAEPLLSWIGLLMAAGAALIAIQADARQGPKKVMFAVACGLGVAITLAISYRYGPAAGWVHGWAGLALIGWFAWVKWLDD